jgi:hypothetical protein
MESIEKTIKGIERVVDKSRILLEKFVINGFEEFKLGDPTILYGLRTKPVPEPEEGKIDLRPIVKSINGTIKQTGFRFGQRRRSEIWDCGEVLVSTLWGDVEYWFNIGHCSGQSYAIIKSEENGEFKSDEHGEYHPLGEKMRRFERTIRSNQGALYDADEGLLRACLEFALQRYASDPNIRVRFKEGQSQSQ